MEPCPLSFSFYPKFPIIFSCNPTPTTPRLHLFSYPWWGANQPIPSFPCCISPSPCCSSSLAQTSSLPIIVHSHTKNLHGIFTATILWAYKQKHKNEKGTKMKITHLYTICVWKYINSQIKNRSVHGLFGVVAEFCSKKWTCTNGRDREQMGVACPILVQQRCHPRWGGAAG